MFLVLIFIMNTKNIEKYIPKYLLPLARYNYCNILKYKTYLKSRIEKNKYKPIKTNKNILIYHSNLLSFGWTEKNLQLIAKNLDKNIYNVFIMYGDNPWQNKSYDRLNYILQWWEVYKIPFKYSKINNKHPGIVHNMTPKLDNIVKTFDIDLFISAGVGYPDFPLTDVKIPIIYLNIFGAPNNIKYIKYNICISNEVKEMINDVVPDKKIEVMYIPTDGPCEWSKELWINLRKKMWFKDSDIVFGRIWRNDDYIYDPIWIKAFEKIVHKYENIKYLIMSPAPKLIQYVNEKKIPNIFLLDPSYAEEDVWAFHEAIDVLAHFRRDGETSGLNISESMIVWNPIISHKSTVNNAHLEYLDKSNSFIAELDDFNQYASYIKIFAQDKEKKLIKEMWKKAKKTADKLFYWPNYTKKFQEIIEKCF